MVSSGDVRRKSALSHESDDNERYEGLVRMAMPFRANQKASSGLRLSNDLRRQISRHLIRDACEARDSGLSESMRAIVLSSWSYTCHLQRQLLALRRKRFLSANATRNPFRMRILSFGLGLPEKAAVLLCFNVISSIRDDDRFSSPTRLAAQVETLETVTHDKSQPLHIETLCRSMQISKRDAFEVSWRVARSNQAAWIL